MKEPSATMEEPSAPSDPGRRPEQSTDLGRRRFLRWVSGIGAAIGGVLVGVPALRAFISPILPTPKTDDWVKVADDIALLDVGTPVRVNFVQSTVDAWLESRTLNGVWLYTEDGAKFKAYNGHCTHLGCSYAYDSDRKNFFCPCHRGQFDVKTGRVLAGPPPRPLDELQVEIRDSAVFVKYRDFRLGIPEQIEA
jgi:menaquinol-cytochrome c reductase iron-sulfur subunit